MLEYLILALTFSIVHSGAITSNIPVIVSPVKNYTTTPPQWLTSPYFRAGNEAVIKTLTGNNTTPTYTFTFSSALPGLPNLAYGIKNYRGNDYLGQQFYQIKKIGLSQATFSVSIQIYGVTNLWLLTVAYLAADPTFPHHLNTFDNVPINNTGGDIVNITTMQPSLTYYTNYVNYTAQAEGLSHTKFTNPLSSNNIVLFMTSFWVRATFGTAPNYVPVKFHIQTGIVNQSYYFWNVTLEVNCLVTNVHFSEIIFNTLDVESSNQYFIVYQTWINDRYGGFIDIPEAFIDNFIMGVTQFETMDGHCGFEYQWEFANGTINGTTTFGVSLLQSWTLTNTCGFQWSLSSIFYMETWLCQAPYYYFNVSSGLCQTYCGGYYYQNTADYICSPCVNTLCYQCDNPYKNLCTNCASYKFYELVNGSCTCLNGYFASTSACVACSSKSTGCMSCTYNDGANGTLAYNSALFTCTICNNSANYFISGKLCQLCVLSNCNLCQNLTACSVCSNTYSLSITLTCVHCYITGCAYCSATNSSYCAVCNATLGYYAAASNSCATKCGDGIFVSGVQQCDDNNTVNYDGCSSTCTIETSFTCIGSPSVCYFASSVTLSLVNTIIETTICDTITFTFKLVPANAVFSRSDIDWTNFLVTPNSSLMTQNNSMFKYSNGNFSASFFLEATIQNQTIVFSTDFSTLLPNTTTAFANTQSNSISFNVLPTNNLTALLQCCTGYYYNSLLKKCLQICGDGILFVLPCDDGNLANGDGCTSACQVQSGYNCTNGSANTSSVCCYSAPVAVTLNSANKDATSNTLSMSYSISPIQPILNLINNSYNFTPYVNVSNPSATITSATYDPSTNTINVVVSYNDTIQGQGLNLNFNPPNVPQASYLPVVSNSWTVAPTNHLSASYYPQSTYDKVKKLQPYSFTCLGLYLALNVVTLFFRKFIGLELATLMQIGYLSLLIQAKLPVELSTISAWKFVFGYNNYYVSSANPTQSINGPFSLYGYQKYFGYSCNLMAIVIFSIYGLSLILIALSAVTAKTLSRKLRSGGLLLLNEVGFALVIFCIPNILVGFCIQIKEGSIFDTSLFWSVAFLVLAITILLVSNIINVVNIEESNEVGTFFRKHSKLGVYCSLFFNIRLILLTVFLFLYQILGVACSYTLIAIQLLYITFIIAGRPHKKPFDFIRSLTIEFSLLFVLLTRYIQTAILGNFLDEASSIYDILAIIELAAYGVCIILSIASLVYHIAKKIKKNKIEPQENHLVEQPKQSKAGQSMGKMNYEKEIQEQSPSKRKIMESNSIIFDVEEMQAETNPYNSTGNSQIKFDLQRKQEKKYRRRR